MTARPASVDCEALTISSAGGLAAVAVSKPHAASFVRSATPPEQDLYAVVGRVLGASRIRRHGCKPLGIDFGRPVYHETMDRCQRRIRPS